MQLALFTSGAALWPVTRNFEAFIASLGGPDAGPARLQRLLRLHREIYSALLRPTEPAGDAGGCFAGRFLPDLEGSRVDRLLEALLFYFLRRRRAEIPVDLGLSALRAVFFNHETSAPELWLAAGLERLALQRAGFPCIEHRCLAPLAARRSDLAFCLVDEAGRPARSAGWAWGTLRRRPDGRLEALLHCGLDPSLEDCAALAAARPALGVELEAALYTAFGWARQAAA